MLALGGIDLMSRADEFGKHVLRLGLAPLACPAPVFEAVIDTGMLLTLRSNRWRRTGNDGERISRRWSNNVSVTLRLSPC